MSIFKSKTAAIGWTIEPCFIITLHVRDLELLDLIKNFFSVGSVSIVGKDARFRVRSRSELNIIIAHFHKYPLQTTKALNFAYFCEILDNINKRVHTNISGFLKLASLINSHYFLYNKETKNYTVHTHTAAVIYKNVDAEKLNILKENRKKSGIYRFINLSSNKSYIGSSKNLNQRFLQYYNIIFLAKHSKSSLIYKALLKYGFSKFSLEIIEYCDPYILLEREQHYIDLLQPEYNLLKIAGSRLGKTHSKETIEKIKKYKKTLEHRTRMSAARLGKAIPIEVRAKMKAVKEIPTTVTDITTGITIKYCSCNDAAKALGVSSTTVRNYKKTHKLYLDKYKIF